MIADKDRSGWFGASDTDRVMNKWDTKTFENWWLEKMGITKNTFCNESMAAGTYFEHSIIDSVNPLAVKDRQILIPELRLRVNLDADDGEEIWEIKTYRLEKGFTLPKKYICQVNVQMYASDIRKANVVAYGLTDEDYKNFFNPIDKKRLSFFPIEYDTRFIDRYLRRLSYLAECLERGVFPDESKV